MARPTLPLIQALRITVDRLRGDTTYQWGHMGECNRGHLRRNSREDVVLYMITWADLLEERLPASLRASAA